MKRISFFVSLNTYLLIVINPSNHLGEAVCQKPYQVAPLEGTWLRRADAGSEFGCRPSQEGVCLFLPGVGDLGVRKLLAVSCWGVGVVHWPLPYFCTPTRMASVFPEMVGV